ncbi:hypothetical protein L1987_46358 [Smallanthus sonchifolius]|uniref:Uncharacterized protein n=1 Tax=Smallanthus sonchifolius TaxID=185202 RepID=A0ACB9FZJ1_9ASTR|nr:hypothetical protein L1987_46358 [Smallanthus sonchifolius]
MGSLRCGKTNTLDIFNQSNLKPPIPPHTRRQHHRSTFPPVDGHRTTTVSVAASLSVASPLSVHHHDTSFWLKEVKTI